MSRGEGWVVRRRKGPGEEAKSARCARGTKLPPKEFRLLCRCRKTPFVLLTSAGSQPARRIETKRSTTMRFMVIVKTDKNSEAGVMPSTELLTAMGKFNEEMVKASVMLARAGLLPRPTTPPLT